MDSKYIIYTGVDLAYLNVVGSDNENLQTILGKINTAVNNMSSAPDYSGYNLYCITETDGVTHPTNTQNFAEGISKIVCDNKDEYDTFVGTTYVADQLVLTTAITNLQVPGLTYSVTAGGGSISITNGMTRNQVLTAIYTGVGDILNLLNVPGNTWASLSITTPHNINNAFNSLIAYQITQDLLIAGKQDELPTYDNTGNCLAGGATDSIYDTVDALITYTCALPTYDNGSITWGGVTTATDLQSAIQNLADGISYLLTNGVVDAGSGLTEAAVGTTYQGKKLSLDTTNTQLYKVMVTGDIYSDADVLDEKISSNDSSLTLSISGNKLNIEVTEPANGKVKVNSSDTTANYLTEKIPSTNDSVWGLGLSSQASTNNEQLKLIPTIVQPSLLFQSMMSYIASDPSLLVQFANLVALSSTTPGTAIIDLVTTLVAGDFVLTWTPQTGNSQQAKWRQRGSALWDITLFSPANPLSAVDNTTTLTPVPMNMPLQMQVDTIYGTGIIGSNISEMIQYDCQTETTSLLAGVISIGQPALPGVDTIEYRLILNAGSVLQETILTAGTSPLVAFAAVPSGTYHVEWRYGTLINGTTLWSDDASQLNAMCSSANIVVP